ncbi:MAG: glycosyltransferase family 4 protein [Acidobacteria bacterium]|nr:glycosyltransferase family 4 protein [Acidobacteriota bacterium]MBI3657610.1 glycosyltransferase family 4 protein [Acidobacteriota bacterium]
MRLAINAFRIAGQRTGVRRYLLNLLQRWACENDAFAETILFTNSPLDKAFVALPKNFRVAVIAQGWPGFLWENLALRHHALQADVLFCPAYTIPMGYQGKSVVTIHDATQEMLAKSFSWWSRIRFAPLYRYSARTATKIITDSHVSKRDLLATYSGISQDKITVIHLAPDTQFQPPAEGSCQLEIRRRFLNSTDPFILFVGKMSLRRNIPLLMAAFAALKKLAKLPHKLILVGLNTAQLNLAELALRFEISQDLVHREYVTDEDLVLLYGAADLFVFPSTYEGFSLPILEAMSCGVPVITVNSSALKEIVAEAALLIDEPNVESLAHAMHRVLTDASLRHSMIHRGSARAQQFSWERAARETLRVLQETAAAPMRRTR